jgi:hypothetical protein
MIIYPGTSYGNDAELLYDAARIETAPVCGYCRDCKHWKAATVLPPIFNYCNLSVGRDNDPLWSTTLAHADNEDGYYCFLVTKSNFACNQWKAKEEQP